MPPKTSAAPYSPTDMAEFTKQELRAILKERRASIEPAQREELDRAIISHVAASPLFEGASMLLIYAPMKGEINLLPLARLARERGIPIAFPRSHTEDCTVTFHILTPDARLSAGAYGIAEPPEDAPLCVPDENALCILPGLSFDRAGNRLGYGKGYYDRFLADFPGKTVGAVYSHLMLKSVPTDAHDKPVMHLATEHGITAAELPPAIPTEHTDYEWQNADTPTEASPKKSAPVHRSFGERVKGAWRIAWSTERAEGVFTPHLPLIPILSAYVLLLLSRLIDARLLDRGSQYVGVILLQILIFILPSVLYCKLSGTRFTERLRLAPIRPAHIPLLAAMLVMMITGGLLTSILTGGIRSLVGSFTLYETFVARTATTPDILYALLAYALLPAFGEELLFRALLCAEYEKNGVGVALIASAFFFALLHFSLAHFLTYFVLGLLLGAAMYATRSFFAPFALHLLYNIFCLLGQPFLSAFYVSAGSTEIFLFCLISLLLLSSAIAAGEGRKIYHLYALKNTDSSYTRPRTWREYPRAILWALFSPLTAVSVVVFLVTALINLL